MKPTIKTALILSLSIVLAASIGSHLGNSPAPAASQQVAARPAPAQAPSQAAAASQAAPASAVAIEPVPAPSTTFDAQNKTLAQLRQAWSQARTLEQLEPIAQAIAEHDNAESTQLLLEGIEHISEWPVRAALAKNLRAISNPETLQTLLPALLNNYGRGNTILNEISDTIARIAQPETVEDLAALHWQASVQAGQGHKVLRTVASIRNPIATRGLMKVATNADSPALAAAASEALKAMREGRAL